MRASRRWILVVTVFLGVAVPVTCSVLRHRHTIVTVLPPAEAEPGRWIVLNGANNTRDIGGYRTRDGRRVRWKQVYRSGVLSSLTDQGGEEFRALGVHRVIDFRYRLAASSWFGGDAACVFRASTVTVLPIQGGNKESEAPAYVQNVRENQQSYRQAFELLADPSNLPLLFHCLSGKDRTGTMTALLLTLLGVERETVMKDYALSDLVGAATNRQAMIDLLDEVDRQGGIERYLQSIGVSPATQAAIRGNLLEEPSAPTTRPE